MFKMLFTNLSETKRMIKIMISLTIISFLISIFFAITTQMNVPQSATLANSLVQENWLAFEQGLCLPFLLFSFWYIIRYIYLFKR